MKSTFYPLIFLLGIATLTLFSCNDDDNGNRPSESVNDFVWRGLNSWYYWKSDVPSLYNENEGASFISEGTPENLFYSLLYQYGETDRFSWIVSDYDALVAQFSGVEQSYGYEFGLYYKDAAQEQLIGYVEYVVPNSPASEAGIERGDIFTEINGQIITLNNYRSLLTQESYTLGLAEVTEVTSNEITVTSVQESVSMSVAVVEENPVHYSTVFEQDGIKVGYLVYNGFRANYNDELNTAIGDLAAEGITNLILDLRYNGGGSLNTSVGLASMITGQFNGQEFVSTNFNSAHSQYNRNQKFDNSLTTYDYINGSLQESGSVEVNNLGLDKLYVLTSRSTASASELLINSLRPYIDVVTIGGTTYGKFVGSITLVDSPSSDFTDANNKNSAHNYAMQPIVFAYFNSENGNNGGVGITPNIPLSERNYLAEGYAFGDSNDPYIMAVMNNINARFSSPITLSEIDTKVSTGKELKKHGSELYLDKPLISQ